MNNSTKNKLIKNSLYGWETIKTNTKVVLIRIPASDGLKKQLYVKYKTNESYFGVPESCSNFEQCQYLEKGKVCKVWVLDKSISELKENVDYFINEMSIEPQYEIKLDLWKEHPYSPISFPLICQYWKIKRPKDYQQHHVQKHLNL